MIWIVVGVCLLISFIFSGIEAGILSVNRVRLRHQVRMRDQGALRLNRLLAQPERLLLTVVIVTNLMNIFAVTLTTQMLVKRLGLPGYLVSFAVFLPLYLFGLELFPKSLFRRFPYRALALLSEPLRWADLILSPVLTLGTKMAHMLVPKQEHDSRKLFAAREDFKYFTVESERTGALTPQERHMIHNVVDFRSVTAKDVMEPLAGFPRIRHTCTLDELIKESNDGTIERFLVESENGEILGMVNLFEVLLDRSPKGKVSSFTRRLVTVPPSDSAPRLLRKIRAARTPVALVVDSNVPKGIIFAGAVYRRLISPPVNPVERQ